MSRAQRLLDLIQVMRRHRRPVSGRDLAAETGVSLRTLYRDIATLQAQGAPIDGEAGVGYVLAPGFMLPPLMFSDEEIEALVLGSRWVAERGDLRLARAARDVLAKISAVLPPDLSDRMDATNLLIGPSGPVADTVDVAIIREAIRNERKIGLAYRDAGDKVTERIVWPFALGFFDRVRVVIAWCELRDGFRHFRTDRIAGMAVTDTRYPRRRQALLKAWREAENIAADKN